MVDCRRYQEELKAYCDRELSWPRRLLVRRHLAQCAACRQEVSDMTQFAEELRATEDVQTPLNPAMRARLLAAAPPAPGPKPEDSPLFRISGWHFAAAGAIVFVLFVLLYPIGGTARRVLPSSAVAGMQQMAMRNMAPQAAQNTAPVSSVPDILIRQVHKEATLGLQVEDPEAQSDRIAQMVKQTGGYVAANTLTTGSDGSRVANMTLDVPVVQFDTILTQISRLGTVQTKDITGEDITDQTSDAQQAEGVMENAVRQSQARLAKLGKQASWNDTETARELAIQLAQARARLVLLRKLGQLSTISVTLTQKPKPAPPVQSGFVSNLGGTTRSATQSLLASASLVLDVLIWMLAYAPIWLPLALIGRWFYRRYVALSLPPGV